MTIQKPYFCNVADQPLAMLPRLKCYYYERRDVFDAAGLGLTTTMVNRKRLFIAFY